MRDYYHYPLGQTNRFPDLRKRDEASASLPVTQVGDTYRDGTTALIMAAQLRHTEIVKSLIEADANVDSRDQQRGTSLMYVGKRSHMGIGKYPVTANSDVTSDNNQDYTSLMYAEQNKHSEVVKHLSEAQAIVCSQDQTVITPLSADPGVRYNEKYLACGKPDAALENNDVNTPVTVVPEKETKRDTKGTTDLLSCTTDLLSLRRSSLLHHILFQTGLPALQILFLLFVLITALFLCVQPQLHERLPALLSKYCNRDIEYSHSLYSSLCTSLYTFPPVHGQIYQPFMVSDHVARFYLLAEVFLLLEKNSSDVHIAVNPSLDDLTMKDGWVPAGPKFEITVEQEAGKVKLVGLPHLCLPHTLANREIKVFQKQRDSSGVVEKDAAEMLTYHVLFEASNIFDLQIGAVSHDKVSIPYVLIMIFHSINFLDKARIVIVPNLEYYRHTVETEQIKAGFYLEEAFDHHCLNSADGCGFSIPRVFVIEYNTSIVKVCPDTNIQIFKPSIERRPIRIAVVNTDNNVRSIAPERLEFDLTDERTNSKYQFLVNSASLERLPDTSACVLFGFCLHLLIHFSTLKYTFGTRVCCTAFFLHILWSVSVFISSYQHNWYLAIASCHNSFAKFVTEGFVTSFIAFTIVECIGNEGALKRIHIWFSVTTFILWILGIINRYKIIPLLSILTMLSGKIYGMHPYLGSTLFCAGSTILCISVRISKF